MSELIIYKTASQIGKDQVFINQEEYIQHQQSSDDEAHKLIRINEVEELSKSNIEITEDHWGNQHIWVDGHKYTITQFFNKYAY